MKKALVILAGLILMAGPAVAAGPNLAAIPAEAKWVAHIDMEAITASTFAAGMMELVKANAEALGQEKVAKADNLWTKLQDVKDITVYGCAADQKGVMVANLAKYDKAEVLKMVGLDPAAAGEKYGNVEVFAFTPKHGPSTEAWIALVSDKLIVGGNDLARVKAQIDLLGGTGTAMGDKHPLATLLAPSAGSFFVAAGLNPKANEEVPAGETGPGAMLRKALQGRVEFGQNGENLVGSLVITMPDQAAAKELVQIAEGMLMLARMGMQQNDQQMAKLSEAIKMVADGANATASVTWPAADVLAKMKAKMEALPKPQPQ